MRDGIDRTVAALALVAAVALACPARAADASPTLRLVDTIAVPGEPLTNFDIGVIDPADGRYYLADRSNAAIDVFDTRNDSFVGRAAGFAGAVEKNGKVISGLSGPDGVVVAGSQVWAGDGDSAFKVIDPVSRGIVGAVRTGGTTRVDEMAYDPKDGVVIGINNAEAPPFATLVSSAPGHAVIGRTVFSDATDGAEAPAYDPITGLFYVAIPQIGPDPKKGGVAVIDPKTGTLVRTMPVEGCRPAGLAFGPGDDFILGCAADGKSMPAVTLVMNAGTGAVVGTVSGLGGSDEVNYNARNRQYYTASRDNPAGPALGVIDAATRTLVQTIPITGGTPHSVASSEATGRVYLPVGATGGGDGTVHVFAPAR